MFVSYVNRIMKVFQCSVFNLKVQEDLKELFKLVYILKHGKENTEKQNQNLLKLSGVGEVAKSWGIISPVTQNFFFCTCVC